MARTATARTDGPQKTRAAAQAANSRRRRRRRTGKKTIHYILLVVFVLAAGAVLSLTTFFKIEAVNVVGTDKYPPDEIVRASGIEVGENLFRVQLGEVEEILTEQFPYIASVDVKRKLPPAIELQVTQHTPAAALLSEGGEVVLITLDGKVLERGSIFVPVDVPVVRGIDVRRERPGQYLDEEAAGEALIMLRYLVEAAEKTGFKHITNVDLSDTSNMRIAYENRLLLKLGTEAELEHKLAFIQLALDDMGPQDEGRIDVSNFVDKKWLIVKDITYEEALALEYKTDMPSDGEAPEADVESGEDPSEDGEDPQAKSNPDETARE